MQLQDGNRIYVFALAVVSSSGVGRNTKLVAAAA